MKKCPQCGAFEAAFETAGARYAAAAYNLEEKISASLLRDADFLKLESEAMSARRDYKVAREALRVHREGHGSEDLKRSG